MDSDNRRVHRRGRARTAGQGRAIQNIPFSCRRAVYLRSELRLGVDDRKAAARRTFTQCQQSCAAEVEIRTGDRPDIEEQGRAEPELL